MKKLTIYQCERCDTQYGTAEKAYNCEQAHPNEEDLKVVSFNFRKLDGAYGSSRAEAQQVPASLLLRWGAERGQIASYKLDHVGMKGL